MVTQDRIRLTGLLRKKPWKRGFFYGPDSPAARQARTAAGVAAVSVEPPGAVARVASWIVLATSRSAVETLASGWRVDHRVGTDSAGRFLASASVGITPH
jgi:hypothetical protein